MLIATVPSSTISTFSDLAKEAGPPMFLGIKGRRKAPLYMTINIREACYGAAQYLVGFPSYDLLPDTLQKPCT